jgi:hypothetical protein
MSKKLEELERKMIEGFGVILMSEGLRLFFQYVHEAIRIIKEQTSKSRR